MTLRASPAHSFSSDLDTEMTGQKFEYDESGSTFFYFLTCFLGLILVPCTFYFWPAGESEGKTEWGKADKDRKMSVIWVVEVCEGKISRVFVLVKI